MYLLIWASDASIRNKLEAITCARREVSLFINRIAEFVCRSFYNSFYIKCEQVIWSARRFLSVANFKESVYRKVNETLTVLHIFCNNYGYRLCRYVMLNGSAGDVPRRSARPRARARGSYARERGLRLGAPPSDRAPERSQPHTHTLHFIRLRVKRLIELGISWWFALECVQEYFMSWLC